MLIQNVTSMAPATQPARVAGDSAPVIVAAAPSEVETKPVVTVEAPQPAGMQADDLVLSPQSPAEQLRNLVESINRVLRDANRSLEFSVDKDVNRQVVKLVDSETGDVIRQFPTDEMLAISHAIDQAQQGLFLKQEA